MTVIQYKIPGTKKGNCNGNGTARLAPKIPIAKNVNSRDLKAGTVTVIEIIQSGPQEKKRAAMNMSAMVSLDDGHFGQF